LSKSKTFGSFVATNNEEREGERDLVP